MALHITQVASKIIFSLSLVAVLIGLTGCGGPSSVGLPEPKLSSLQLQQLQTKEYETTKEILFASVLSVLQDDGYIITTADSKIGLISAKSPVIDEGFNFTFGSGGYQTGVISVTIFIEKITKERIKVRFNFIHKSQTRNVAGGVAYEVAVEDGKFYENLYSKLRKTIYMKENIH